VHQDSRTDLHFHPAGAPPANATFFCTPARGSFTAGPMNPAACYLYQSTNVTQATARAGCRALGGDLVQYATSASQLLVEDYFTTSGVLSNYSYYVGIQRASSSSPYLYSADNSSLPQGASTAPYAHWNWHQAAAAATPGYDCVLALAAYSYGFYLGDTSAVQQANASFYQTDPTNPDATYGWNAFTCSGRYHSICQLPEDVFGCSPPPSPPPVPPMPSPPPSPPYPPTCAPLFNSTFFCNHDVTACYSSSGNRTANFTGALQQCSSLGGSLSKWTSGEQQHLAESYFRWAPDQQGCACMHMLCMHAYVVVCNLETPDLLHCCCSTRPLPPPLLPPQVSGHAAKVLLAGH
jgi:hypothetical protein